MCKVIGIDISKQTFDVSFLKKNQWVYCKFENNPKGFKSFFKLVETSDKVIMEASGPYYVALANFLYDKEVLIVVENPLVIKRFSQTNLYRAKTDKKDAQTIAQYGQRFDEDLRFWKPYSQNTIKIQQIMSHLEMIDKQLHQTKRQLHAFETANPVDIILKKEMNRSITQLNKSKLQLEQHMAELASQEYQETLDNLKTIPGIGPKTAIVLCVLTDNFTKFETSKQLIAYLGLSPRIYQSGTSINGRGHICKMGSSHARKMLYMCSWSAKKHNQSCVELYERLAQRGKPERVIKIAIVNKLVRLAFAVGKNNYEYNENFTRNICF